MKEQTNEELQDSISGTGKGVKVSNVKLSTHQSYNELSADVDGDRVWIRAPQDFPLVQRGEIFVAAGLLEAMIRNEPLIIDDSAPVSEKLLTNLTELQNIYRFWNSDLSIISIYAKSDAGNNELNAVASFYSGGIDSSQTLVTHMEEITHLIYVRGFGEFLTDDEWKVCVARNDTFANGINKKLLPIDSNIWRFFNKRKISGDFSHGLILGGLAGTLGFEKVFIPSSHTYAELFPWGSHPMIDPLWSTDQTTIVHDSAYYRRTEKTEIVASEPEVLDNLLVCWRSNKKNCGTCPKCVRTRITLDLQGVESNVIPNLKDLSQLEVLYPKDESALTFIEDIMLLAKKNEATKIFKILRKGWRRYYRMTALAQFDRVFLGGVLRRIRHLKSEDWREVRVSLFPKERIDF